MCADKRAYSLDALRGYAILTMILSATIAFGILPGWMYHAQVPPPDHHFDPTVYGITWVDLVFPFFLFAMGAAFPFSIGKKLAGGVSRVCLLKAALLRGGQLTFFCHLHTAFVPLDVEFAPGQPGLAYIAGWICFAVSDVYAAPV